MTESEFNKLLQRYEDGLCTKEERATLERWIDLSGKENISFDNELNRQGIKYSLKEAIFKSTNISGKTKERKLTSFITKIAASLLIAGGVAYLTWKMNNPVSELAIKILRIHSGNKIEKVLLPDSSIVWLKPNSTVIFPDRFTGNERTVTLEGEALFEVEKNPRRPFIIHCGEITARVLGTSFNIKEVKEFTEVSVLTGKVSVSLKQTNEKIDLKPGERVVYTFEKKELVKTQEPKEEKEKYLLGTEYDMNFRNVSIEEIAKRVEGKFNVKIVLNQKMASCRVTADFTDQSMMNTLNMITEAVNATYTMDEDVIVFNGNGCE